MNRLRTCLLFIILFSFGYKGVAQSIADSLEIIPQEFSSQFQADQKRYLEYTKPSSDSVGRAFAFWEAAKKGNWKDYNIDSLFLVATTLKEKALLKKIEFIKLNPNSYSSLYYFKQSVFIATQIKPDSLSRIFSQLSKNIKTTSLGNYVRESINQKQSISLNKVMPDFSFKTNTGQVIDLSSFRGQKHVLLCFWASWCGPCVRNIPFLKDIDEKYKSKDLQLLSVSVDKDTSNWLGAVEKFNMPWLQTCDLPMYANKNISWLYQLNWIPQYFLLDKSGKLIYQNFLSDDTDGHQVLENFLKKELD